MSLSTLQLPRPVKRACKHSYSFLINNLRKRRLDNAAQKRVHVLYVINIVPLAVSLVVSSAYYLSDPYRLNPRLDFLLLLVLFTLLAPLLSWAIIINLVKKTHWFYQVFVISAFALYFVAAILTFKIQTETWQTALRALSSLAVISYATLFFAGVWYGFELLVKKIAGR